MASTDKLFAGPIPELYDRLLVPLLFEPYAADLADRVAKAKPRRILEVAAGTGALTRAMAARLDGEARIVASDLNQPMLDQAVGRLGADARITWPQADALALPFEDGGFDLVACQFGVMFFPDKAEGYKEARRVLKPGGLYVFNVWDSIAENEFARVVTEALATVFPDDPPRFMERVPHGYHDTAAIRRELAAAGFGAITIEAVARKSRAGSAGEAALAYCQGTPLRMEIETRDQSGLEAATQAAAEALARRFGDGPIEGRISAHVVSAVKV
ncbi:class I SAM-dependent methyltransferase [Bosea sp. (in: a-proteobacteria)]|jgi:SAM-dependent methyltransferase|uniref:class I SAM-dependent methyltransferase n=1 Tax=Bosea sp. (in: a-proteobacteria) TaxID=1871050 RepID=UPI003F6F6463